MLGETVEQEDARERSRERTRLMHLAFAPLLIERRPDVAGRLMDRLLAGPEPKAEHYGNPWREWDRLVWWTWRALIALQTQRRRLSASA